MNNKAINFIKNFSYSLSSNLISFLVSIIVILIVPKLLGIKEYGYWQLYLFYSSYLGLLHFGWNDGIYLRYGGKEYKDLDKKLFFSQFWMLVIFQMLIGIVILIISGFFISDTNKLFIFQMIAFGTILVNVRYMVIYIFQGTNRIKEYSQIILIEKVLYCILILLLLLLIGIREYKLLIIADIIGKSISLAYSIFCCKDIIFNRISLFYCSLRETFINISIGIKLMFANIASILIVGIVRFGIERAWDVTTFGKVSLTLSASNLIMVFVNAIGIIMFPVLRRTNEVELPKIYKTMRTFLMVPLIGLLIIYFPLKVLLSAWLPQYSESLIYMALLFPICVYEGKMAMLINTYLKTLRKERLMLLINIVAVMLSIILTILFTMVYKNLSLAILSIVLLLSFRCILAEVLLSRKLKINVSKDLLLELVMTIIFIMTAWFMSSVVGAVLYLLAYGLYILINISKIKSTFFNVKKIIRG